MNHSQMLKPMLIGAAVLFGLSLFGVPVGNFLFLILLVCPLMMIFMMRGMNHGGGQDTREDAHAGHHHREET